MVQLPFRFFLGLHLLVINIGKSVHFSCVSYDYYPSAQPTNSFYALLSTPSVVATPTPPLSSYLVPCPTCSDDVLCRFSDIVHRSWKTCPRKWTYILSILPLLLLLLLLAVVSCHCPAPIRWRQVGVQSYKLTDLNVELFTYVAATTAGSTS